MGRPLRKKYNAKVKGVTLRNESFVEKERTRKALRDSASLSSRQDSIIVGSVQDQASLPKENEIIGFKQPDLKGSLNYTGSMRAPLLTNDDNQDNRAFERMDSELIDFEASVTDLQEHVLLQQEHYVDIGLACKFPSGPFNLLQAQEEEEWGIIDWVACPLHYAFLYTCPQNENWYALCFLVSFIWVAGFSYLISAIIENFVDRTGVSVAFFGLVLVAVGAEIPDTIQSVTFAKRNYGSMAVSNCIGSQITNLCIGLGLSWEIANLSHIHGGGVNIGVVETLRVAVIFQGGAVLLFSLLLLGKTFVLGRNKVLLDKCEAYILCISYWLILGGYAVYCGVTGKIFND